MSYTTSKLQTKAECDKAIELANGRKEELIFDQTVSGRDLTDQEKSTAQTTASLVSTKAQITGTEAAIAVMPDGDAKLDLQSKLRRLNDRKENLEERLQKTGAAALLDTELNAALLSAQVVEINSYISAVTTRKGEL
jgi:hypothetical protein